jgi:hypothetical protein
MKKLFKLHLLFIFSTTIQAQDKQTKRSLF